MFWNCDRFFLCGNFMKLSAFTHCLFVLILAGISLNLQYKKWEKNKYCFSKYKDKHQCHICKKNPVILYRNIAIFPMYLYSKIITKRREECLLFWNILYQMQRISEFGAPEGLALKTTEVQFRLKYIFLCFYNPLTVKRRVNVWKRMTLKTEMGSQERDGG